MWNLKCVHRKSDKKKHPDTAPGWKKCDKGTTTCCPYTLPNKTLVTGLVTGFKHQIKDPVNCETRNCIYYLICRKINCKEYPKCEYIGLTTRPCSANKYDQKTFKLEIPIFENQPE